MLCGKMSPDGAVANKSKAEAVFYPQAGYILHPTTRSLSRSTTR
jgi:hypothetical protein